MTRLRRGAVWAGVGFAALIAGLAACDEPTSNNGNGGGGGGGGGSIADPATLQALMEQVFVPVSLGVIDGFDRLLVAIDGGPQDGVVIIPTGPTSVSAQVSLDLDGDGSRESTASGGASGDIQTGATISVDGVTNPSLPSLTVSLASTVTQTGPTSVMFDNVAGAVQDNAAVVILTDGAVSLDLASGNPIGFVDLQVSGEDAQGTPQTIDASATFESNGQGGWQIHFTGTGFDFTVP